MKTKKIKLSELRTLVKKIINEENYDFVSQYKGIHQGKSIEKNKFLTSLGLDESGIETLQTYVNSMLDDKNWVNKKYPNGYRYGDVIHDISDLVKSLPEFIKNVSNKNPISVVNMLKSKLLSK